MGRQPDAPVARAGDLRPVPDRAAEWTGLAPRDSPRRPGAERRRCGALGHSVRAAVRPPARPDRATARVGPCRPAETGTRVCGRGRRRGGHARAVSGAVPRGAEPGRGRVDPALAAAPGARAARTVVGVSRHAGLVHRRPAWSALCAVGGGGVAGLAPDAAGGDRRRPALRRVRVDARGQRRRLGAARLVRALSRPHRTAPHAGRRADHRRRRRRVARVAVAAREARGRRRAGRQSGRRRGHLVCARHVERRGYRRRRRRDQMDRHPRPGRRDHREQLRRRGDLDSRSRLPRGLQPSREHHLHR